MRNNVLSSKHANNNNTMESFYEDANAQFLPATTNGGGGGGGGGGVVVVTTGNGNGLKRPATLELNLGPGKARKTRYNTSITMPSVLPSPDLQMLKLVSPELEKIISTNATLPTPTPSAIIFPPSATSEQQQFAKGFEDALLSIHKKDTTSKLNTNVPTNTASSNNNNNSSTSNNNNNNNSANSVTLVGPSAVERLCPTTAAVAPVTAIATANTATSMVAAATVGHHTGMSGGEITYTNLDYPGVVKEEPQPTTSAASNQSPPVSPIDMESQERIKLERKRLRNRVAASKCRKRKLERISKLEDRVKELKAQNAELGGVVCNLKQHIFQLKQQVIEHHNSGCTITLQGKF